MKRTILSLILAAAPCSSFVGTAEDYVAHEWGTFTSVQGADGVLIEWNPLESTQLPRFVYDWSKPGMNRLPPAGLNRDLKGRFVTLQRMETPVIYLYSEIERSVDVTVRFPQGLITEWYPQAREIGPSAFPPNKLATALDGFVQQSGLKPQVTFASMFGKQGVPDSRIAWKEIRVLPANRYSQIANAIPTDAAGNHYFAARETDAAFVRVGPLERSKPAEHEKFLFYRGVANFKTPLNVTIGGANEGWFQLGNTGAGELRHLFILSVRKGHGKFVYAERLAPGEYQSVDFGGQTNCFPLTEVVAQLGQKMREALMKEGLYEREAAAMVKTWREAWFEEGLRVLYTLPRAWTDEILPLTLDPNPRELVRVMVGRAEIIPATVKWELLKQIVRHSEGDPAGRHQAITKVRDLGLGRFIQPAVEGVLGTHPSQEFSKAARELLDAATAKPRDEKSLAAK